MAGKTNPVMKGLKFVFGLLVNLIIVILIIQGFTFSFEFGNAIFADLPKNGADTSKVTVTILADSSSKEVIDQIYDSGVIDDKYVFMVRTYVEKYYKQMMPGTYELSPSMSTTEILQTITGQVAEE